MDKNFYNNVIKELDTEFDTHNFIEKFIVLSEKKYVNLLHSHIDTKKGIFRAAHSEIGRFLSVNSFSLKIEKVNTVTSENIKKYDSKNQNWRKTH